VEKNLGFRGWFYFRTGWATYFAFIVAAVNALTVTFFLAIEKYPSLSVIFPTFFHYIVIIVGICSLQEIQIFQSRSGYPYRNKPTY